MCCGVLQFAHGLGIISDKTAYGGLSKGIRLDIFKVIELAYVQLECFVVCACVCLCVLCKISWKCWFTSQ